MFPKRVIVIVAAVALLAASILGLSVTNSRFGSHGIGRLAILTVAPLQERVTRSLRFVDRIWHHYFDLVATAEENDRLHRELSRATARSNYCTEVELANRRLRRLLAFRVRRPDPMVAAEVIGKDPSPWFKTVIIDKGRDDGIRKGLPVVVPEGVVGQVTEVAAHHAKVLLIIDRNSAVDALVQRTRARGIIQGGTAGECTFNYVLRKHDVRAGDTVVASGLDGVFPKGVQVGEVSSVIRRNAGIFQEVTVAPYVDFGKLEEVLVVMGGNGSMPPTPAGDVP